jgi:hypothetical protein
MELILSSLYSNKNPAPPNTHHPPPPLCCLYPSTSKLLLYLAVCDEWPCPPLTSDLYATVSVLSGGRCSADVLVFCFEKPFWACFICLDLKLKWVCLHLRLRLRSRRWLIVSSLSVLFLFLGVSASRFGLGSGSAASFVFKNCPVGSESFWWLWILRIVWNLSAWWIV